MDARQQAIFKREALLALASLGNKPKLGDERLGYDYTVATKAGLLSVKIETTKRLASVFMRFHLPDQAAQYVAQMQGLNIHSGKWNFHMAVQGKYSAEAVLSRFREFLSPMC